MQMSTKKLSAGAMIIIILFSSLLRGDDSEELTVRIYAEAIDQAPPKYPYSERRREQEGWVIVNFIVEKDGTVSDPVVEDSNGITALNRQAIKTVSNWLYKPATINGEPIQQCHTKVMVVFQIEDLPRSVSKKFNRRYRKIIKTIKENSLEEAESMLAELFDMKGLNLYETSWLWILRANIANKKGDRVAELTSLYRASKGGDEILSASTYSHVLTNKFALELENKLYADALDTYEIIANYKDFAGDINAIVSSANSIKELAQADTYLAVDGLISDECDCGDERRYWTYQLLRRKISFLKIQGKLDKFELRCEWKHFVDKVNVEKAWEVPESWGNCLLLVFGEDKTKFQLVEYPGS